jgi:hypothetical protein
MIFKFVSEKFQSEIFNSEINGVSFNSIIDNEFIFFNIQMVKNILQKKNMNFLLYLFFPYLMKNKIFFI